ncbi:MAG: outer membrane beta-barrel protein [Rikenellaceae bacterium]
MLKNYTKLFIVAAIACPALLTAQTASTTATATSSETQAQREEIVYNTDPSKVDTTLYNPETFDTMFEKVNVKYRDTRAEQKGDSLIYNANAFKVLDGSSAEDLLSKMPGIVVEGGEIQAQGESVQKIMLDGKEFFEGDVSLAIQSLPADIIESIEVFDKASEQAEFTGFDDGDQIKTINIVTKEEFRVGAFGEAYAGYGTDDRYKSGATVNIFDSDTRVTLLGMSNNINQTGFSQEDLAGVMSSSTSGRRGSSNSTMLGSTSGVTSSNAFGTNITDQWGEKMEVTGSYFFNNSKNEKEQDTDREYFTTQTYEQWYESKMTNFNHRLNMKFDYTLNDNNTFTFTPSLSFQNNSSDSYTDGQNYFDGVIGNGTINDSDTDTKAYSLSGEAVYRHRFSKAGRTVSVSLNGSKSKTDGETYTDYLNSYAASGDVAAYDDELYQYKKTLKNSYSVRANVMYTEQLLTRLQLSTSYRVSYSDSDSDQRVYNDLADVYLHDPQYLDEESSSTFVSNYLTQQGGLGLKFNNGSFMVSINGDVQYATLDAIQQYPFDDNINHNYLSVLPSAFGRWTINRTSSLMFRYRSNTSNPSISDLQEVLDDSNQLFLSTGNADLDQSTTHSANIRYVYTSTAGTSLILMFNGSMTQNYVADETYLSTVDGSEYYGITVDEGVQFTRPVNLDGRYTAQTMVTYGFPVDFIRSNINVSATANISNTPTLYNGEKSETRDLTIVPKVVIGSNISKKFDFTLTYSSSISQALSSAANSADVDNYIAHSATAKIGAQFWKDFTFSSYLSYVGYTGIELDDPDYYMLSASIGKKFLKNNAGEIKIEASDILKENRSFSRSVGSSYIQYRTSNVLNPFYMITFKYTFR